MDMNPKGIKFMWINKRDGDKCIKDRIDIGLVSHDWIHNFSWSLSLIPKVAFDHFALVFVADSYMGRRKFPFRFEKIWLNIQILYLILKGGGLLRWKHQLFSKLQKN